MITRLSGLLICFTFTISIMGCGDSNETTVIEGKYPAPYDDADYGATEEYSNEEVNYDE